MAQWLQLIDFRHKFFYRLIIIRLMIDINKAIDSFMVIEIYQWFSINQNVCVCSVSKICTDTMNSSPSRPKTTFLLETVGRGTLNPLPPPPSPFPKGEFFLVDLTNCPSYQYKSYWLFLFSIFSPSHQ